MVDLAAAVDKEKAKANRNSLLAENLSIKPRK